MPPSDVESLYHQRLAAYRERTSAGLTAAWDELDTYGDEEMETYVARVTPLLEGAKAATVATSAAFFALTLGVRPAAVSAADVEVESKTDHPFLAMWHALKVGRPLEEAIAAGRSQANAVGYDYVQSTSRRTGDHVAKASGERVRWRRVPGGNACSWCKTIAGQTYHSAASADFGHNRCDCIAVPAK